MNEAQVRAEVFNLLERLYYWPITQTDARTPMSKEVWGLLYALEQQAPDQKSLIGALRGALSRVNTPPIGRPDILVLNPVGPSIVVECKVFDKPRNNDWSACSFDTNSVTPEQRWWMTMWEADRGKAYLALGTVHGRPNSAKEPRLLWLIPWHTYLDLEERVWERGVKTIPLAEYKGMRMALRDAGLWATCMFAGYDLQWNGGCWHLPNGHPAWMSLPYRERDERDLSAWKVAWKGESDGSS